MADVLEVKRKHYSGLDADKAGITGALGDTYAANDSGKAYYWNDSLSAWKTGLGYEYVPRSPAAPDKGVGDFVTDGTWKVNGLDLSAIVPAGAVAVVLRVEVNDDAADSLFQVRQNAVAIETKVRVKTHVAGLTMNSYATLPIDADRLYDYHGENLVFTTINIYVLGWFI